MLCLPFSINREVPTRIYWLEVASVRRVGRGGTIKSIKIGVSSKRMM